ncbi:hypothetical protein B296_00038698 [Ensete ventricosum]|uniref:Uncharacterized protein n=1 Tax=Ensete ventricosum TaxID=4639 RepID=A0A426X9K5_ENSVE|nr:hypothetical protein B296_00038698 [Ensete ventricosum]
MSLKSCSQNLSFTEKHRYKRYYCRHRRYHHRKLLKILGSDSTTTAWVVPLPLGSPGIDWTMQWELVGSSLGDSLKGSRSSLGTSREITGGRP